MKAKRKKISVQISEFIHNTLKQYCNNNGYKLSGFVEKAILSHISGSIEYKQKE
jgi:hypothetical protein